MKDVEAQWFFFVKIVVLMNDIFYTKMCSSFYHYREFTECLIYWFHYYIFFLSVFHTFHFQNYVIVHVVCDIAWSMVHTWRLFVEKKNYSGIAKINHPCIYSPEECIQIDLMFVHFLIWIFISVLALNLNIEFYFLSSILFFFRTMPVVVHTGMAWWQSRWFQEPAMFNYFPSSIRCDPLSVTYM